MGDILKECEGLVFSQEASEWLAFADDLHQKHEELGNHNAMGACLVLAKEFIKLFELK